MTAIQDDRRVLARLEIGQEGELSSPVDIPINITKQQLQSLCESTFPKDESTPYRFFINNTEITSTLTEILNQLKIGLEKVIPITCQPQAVFRVRAVTRCTSSMAGHGDSVLHARFSPDGKSLASGSGDKTVRFWDLQTQLPLHTCSGHVDWVMAVAWAGNGRAVASGCKRGEIFLWDPRTGGRLGSILRGHSGFINSLVFRPASLDGGCRYLASGSKDSTVRVWDCRSGITCRVLTSHTSSVTSVRWGVSDLLYSGSHDRSIKVWKPLEGVLLFTLTGHAHWVNQITLNTDHLLRTGPFDPSKPTADISSLSDEQVQKRALDRVAKFLEKTTEMLASASDDFTAMIWVGDRQIARLTGHQALINDMCFSPDGQLLATASFDKSIKVWRARDGSYLNTLRGHVARVYQIAWSPDSRLICSGSFDSTVKVWDVERMKLLRDLPGHSKEVFTVDWSSDGQTVVSGSFDKLLKIWRY